MISLLRARAAPTSSCPRCLYEVPGRAPACPRCGLVRQRAATHFEAWEARGLFEITIALVVTVFLVVAWIVLWLTK